MKRQQTWSRGCHVTTHPCQCVLGEVAEQKPASHTAVTSPWVYPSSARILRSLNKVPPVYGSLSPSLCWRSHDRNSSCWLYIQLRWYSSPSHSHSFLFFPFPQHQPVQNTVQSADSDWLSSHRSCCPSPLFPCSVFSLLCYRTVPSLFSSQNVTLCLFAKQLLPVSKQSSVCCLPQCNAILLASLIILLLLWTALICLPASINSYLLCGHRPITVASGTHHITCAKQRVEREWFTNRGVEWSDT